MNWLEETSNTPDDSGIRYFIEVDLRYPDFPFCPENKVIP